ncbi:hypothetical protein Tco_0086201 [Tanacetum coccineum]
MTHSEVDLSKREVIKEESKEEVKEQSKEEVREESKALVEKEGKEEENKNKRKLGIRKKMKSRENVPRGIMLKLEVAMVSSGGTYFSGLTQVYSFIAICWLEKKYPLRRKY